MLTNEDIDVWIYSNVDICTNVDNIRTNVDDIRTNVDDIRTNVDDIHKCRRYTQM